MSLGRPMPRLLQRCVHLPRRTFREFLRFFLLFRLLLINQHSESPVAQPGGGPVVSLTTYGQRSQMVHFAIESIARGSMRPSRLILWIDEENLFHNLPAAIRRLQKRGLEVKRCKNYGPHKKYYPYLESQEAFDLPLVTADDDVLYPRSWLNKLVEAHQEYPKRVNCYRARVIDLDKGRIRKYIDLRHCDSTDSSFRHIAVGRSGVIYPPSFLAVLKRAGTDFEDCCPKGDDLWLHVQALRSGYKVRQILRQLPYFSFQGIPGTERTSLSFGNVTFGAGNDRQIRATYKESDLQLIRMDCVVAPN